MRGIEASRSSAEGRERKGTGGEGRGGDVEGERRFQDKKKEVERRTVAHSSTFYIMMQF